MQVHPPQLNPKNNAMSKKENTHQKTVEQKVAETILQQPKTIQIGSRLHTIAPPSVATLILASEAISLLPHETLDENHIIEQSLYMAKYCRPLGDIAAIMLLGAKNLTKTETVREEVTKPVEVVRYKSYLWGLFKKPVRSMETRTETVEREVVKDCKKELSDELLEALSPKELHHLVATMIADFQLGDFFGLTTFLTGVNLIRPTKVVSES